MANSSRTIMTDAGFALETRVRADETKMQFTRAAISTDDHFSDTDDALAKLTELSNIQQDGKVTAVQVINTTTVYVQVDVNQAESKDDYQMRSAALYAKDDDGTEVLYGVTVLQDPVFVHKDADGSYLGFGINTTVGKASNVVVVVDPANMVTQQVFEGTMKNYYTKAEVDAKFVTDDDFASKLPKNIATTDAANTFAKSQTLAGGATDGAGNAIATTKDVSDGDATTLKSAKEYADTQVSGKADDSTVVHTADMRKPASDVAGIKEVNAKQDKIGYTPADDSKVVHSTVTDLKSTDMNTVITAGFYMLRSGTNGIPSGDDHTIYQVIPYYSSNGVQLAYGTNNAILGMRSWNNYNSFTSWVQFADDSKVVHSTDMRTPASNVAGIEEVNAKQDKIGYTPADDSKVIHSTITQLNSTDMNTVFTAGFYQSINGTNGIPSGDNWTIYQVIPLSNLNGVQLAYGTNNAILGMRSWNNYNSFTSWVQFADDSKVAHLSGANNFDTVPTVNNNPLLLASSLPSDLARTSQQTNFTGKLQQNGQNVALANNTIARNPDTGVVSEPTDFTNLTVNGGKSVATSDDLKSLEASAWRPLKLVSSTSGAILFKDNGDGTASLTGSAIFNVAPGKDNFVAEVDAPDGYVFTSVDWKINIGSSTQIIGIKSQYAISETSNSQQQALKVRIQDGNLLIGGSDHWNLNNLITFNAYATNLKTVSLAGSPATIGITKLN